MAYVNCLLKVKLFGGKEKGSSLVIIDVRFPTFSTFTLSQALHIDERTQKEAGESVETSILGCFHEV